MNKLELEQGAISLVNASIAKRFRLVPKSLVGNVLHVYMDNQVQDSFSNSDLETLLERPIKIHKANTEAINQTISEIYLSDDQQGDFRFGTTFSVQDLVEEAKELRASDIHIEAYEGTYRIRLRIDGLLIERYSLKPQEFFELVNKVKIDGNIDITERRLPQDGRIKKDGLDLRVSVLPTLHGEKVVMRLLGNDAKSLNISQLGFDQSELELFKQSINRPNGIILLSGPTGSGKTTTLYAALNHLNDVTRNIVTIEDPIEYTLSGINQVQLRENIGLNFTAALKSFLRQDPDIIMLGEIRDQETAQMALRASLTGHLVLSTIHTNSARGIITRLLDMKVPSYLISETLNLAIAQRLLRKLCTYCKRSLNPEELPYKKVLDLSDSDKLYHGEGCKQCNYTGFKGRVAIYDLFSLSREESNLLKDDRFHEVEQGELNQLAKRAIKVFKDGLTSFSEILPYLKNK